jgi:adenylate cyclase
VVGVHIAVPRRLRHPLGITPTPTNQLVEKDHSGHVPLHDSLKCMGLCGPHPGHVVTSTRKHERHLAAVFCADVSGYTRLMNADEASTLRLLASHRAITDRLILEHGGRIANTAGDSILAEFPSAVDALQCALGIQEKIAAVNEEVPEERRVSFRIGVHVGEVIVRDGDLFGDDVNVAARMQSLAQPGSVCLSGAAHEYVHRTLPLPFEDLGPQTVKNLRAPVRAYLARPSGQPISRAIPPVHRRNEIHLARRFHEVCHRALMEVAGPRDLTTFEVAVLASLRDAPGLNQRQLAERTGINLTKVQPIVRGLERRGLVARTPKAGSRRWCALSLTAAGLEVHTSLRMEFIAVQDRAMAALSGPERETLRDLLARVIKANAVDPSRNDDRQS